MPDKEKVIKRLEEAETMLAQAVDRGGEMSVIGAFKCLNRVKDALVLLKEQEAVKIEVKKINNSGRCGRCPNCLIELNETDYPKFCGYCGQKVKWND